jgi:hypothetical protein
LGPADTDGTAEEEDAITAAAAVSSAFLSSSWLCSCSRMESKLNSEPGACCRRRCCGYYCYCYSSVRRWLFRTSWMIARGIVVHFQKKANKSTPQFMNPSRKNNQQKNKGFLVCEREENNNEQLYGEDAALGIFCSSLQALILHRTSSPASTDGSSEGTVRHRHPILLLVVVRYCSMRIILGGRFLQRQQQLHSTHRQRRGRLGRLLLGLAGQIGKGRSPHSRKSLSKSSVAILLYSCYIICEEEDDCDAMLLERC